MLVNGERSLAYIVTVDEIKPIPNYDRVEMARTNGWWCIVQKNQFRVGDKAVYFEIDSLCPSTDARFAFLEPRKYKVKTLKMCKTISQGLLMPLSDFPELTNKSVGDDVAKILGVKYYVQEDNVRKSNNVDNNAKYNAMCGRHKTLSKKKWWKFMMRYNIGRKILFIFFGKKSDNPKKFPSWIKKTDEERIENKMFMFDDKESEYVVTEKIDGTSATYFVDMGKRKHEFGVCSRNVRQTDINQETYHTSVENNLHVNVYWEMAIKYNIEDVLVKIAKQYNANKVVLQGEIYGESIQKNKLNIKGRDFAAFNLILDGDRLGSIEAKNILSDYGINFVPIVDDSFKMPDDFEELKCMADGNSAINKHAMREGFVYRSKDGKQSCKNVSRKFLLSVQD